MKTEVKHSEVPSTVPTAHYPLHPLIATRKSNRAYSEKRIEPEKLLSVFDAARWAPSASNIQPWRFIVALQEHAEDHQRMVNLLFDTNRIWAEKAPVLILSVAQVTDGSSRKTNKFAFHDVGLATENLILQASSVGLTARVMGGFYADRARATFNIPAEYESVAVIALGYEGQREILPQALVERESAPRVRKGFSEFVFGNIWGVPSAAVPNDGTSILNNSINN